MNIFELENITQNAAIKILHKYLIYFNAKFTIK